MEPSEEQRARNDSLYAHYLGHFTLAEPKRDIEKRVDQAIDHSLASLNLATRLIGKPIMKVAAMIPETIEFCLHQGHVQIIFSRKLVLEAELGGPPRHQKVMTGAWADVSHAIRDGAVESRIHSDSGTVVNRYELRGDELLGKVLMQSPHLPKDIAYTAKLVRRPR
jgi:hypothetical protein